jgi:hypothetical protein
MGGLTMANETVRALLGRSNRLGSDPRNTSYAGGNTSAKGTATNPMPVIRGLVSTDSPQLGHFSDHPAVLEFTVSEEMPALAALGTSCPDHFLRTKVRPLVLDLPPTAPLDAAINRLRELHKVYRADYQAYYERYATPDSPPMRGAVGRTGPGCLELREAHRFPNVPVGVGGTLYWDILRLYSDGLDGLRAAALACGPVGRAGTGGLGHAARQSGALPGCPDRQLRGEGTSAGASRRTV